MRQLQHMKIFDTQSNFNIIKLINQEYHLSWIGLFQKISPNNKPISTKKPLN